LTEIQVDYTDGSSETIDFVDRLYDLSWEDYRPIEKTLKLNAKMDRNGDIQELQINEDEFVIKFQEAIAKAILNSEGIGINEVKVSTVKQIIEEYGEDHEGLNVKLKKKGSKLEDLVELWGKGHNPSIDDYELEQAIKMMNMMESGFTIKPDECRKITVELVNLIQSTVNKKKMKNQRKLKQKMNQGGNR